MIEVTNLEILNALVNKEEGEEAFLTETKEYYIYKNGQWEKEQKTAGVPMTLYSLNQSIFDGQKPLTSRQMRAKAEEINSWADEKDKKFYMLLGYKIDYYTMFILKSEGSSSMGEEVVACLKNLGAIKSIEPTESKEAFECWVSDKNGTKFLMLFPYDEGVIQCR